jgi:hypothetical protein
MSRPRQERGHAQSWMFGDAAPKAQVIFLISIITGVGRGQRRGNSRLRQHAHRY